MEDAIFWCGSNLNFGNEWWLGCSEDPRVRWAWNSVFIWYFRRSCIPIATFDASYYVQSSEDCKCLSPWLSSCVLVPSSIEELSRSPAELLVGTCVNYWVGLLRVMELPKEGRMNFFVPFFVRFGSFYLCARGLGGGESVPLSLSTIVWISLPHAFNPRPFFEPGGASSWLNYPSLLSWSIMTSSAISMSLS